MIMNWWIKCNIKLYSNGDSFVLGYSYPAVAIATATVSYNPTVSLTQSAIILLVL